MPKQRGDCGQGKVGIAGTKKVMFSERRPDHTCGPVASLSASSDKGMCCDRTVVCEEKLEWKSLAEDPALFSWA